MEVRFIGPAMVAFSVLLLLAIEAGVPLRGRKYAVRRRVVVNLSMWAIAFLINAFIVRPASEHVIAWTPERKFGLLNAVVLPSPLQFAVGFLLMDFSFYYWHRLNHAFRLLWRFHNVHHIDPDLDVLTSFRFHFIEILYSTGFRVIQLGLIGIGPLTFMVYELAFQYATMFHHSNVRLPIRAARWLNKIIVTPRMHGIHHSMVKEETNANYSVIFRWWDLLNGSLRLNVPQAEIDIGVPAYQEREDNRLWHLICAPFLKQRAYWRLPDGARPARAWTGEKSVMME